MVRLLAVGNDPTIALPAERVQGDTHQRQLRYASILEHYHLITQAPPSADVPARIQLANNFWVSPCGGKGMASYLAGAVRTGWRIAREERIQVVSTQDPFLTGLVGYLIAERYKLPLSLQFVADAVDNPLWLAEKPYYRVLNLLAHWLIKRAATFRVVSSAEKEKLIGLGVPAERIWNLPSLSDFARFNHVDGEAIRCKYLHGLEGTTNGGLVLAVARLVPQKDIPALLRAFAGLSGESSSATLLIVGSGPLEQQLRRQAQSLGLSDRTVFAGPVAYDQLPAYYAACDVLALSSRYEGNARVLAEAAASARPVVSTAVSGAADTIMDGETGYIVPIGDSAAMTRRLSELLGNRAKAKSMGEKARAHILDLYDPEKLLSGFRMLWETTAAGQISAKSQGTSG
jgi:glycosyltransferase involved in cell wall biosynthesis